MNGSPEVCRLQYVNLKHLKCGTNKQICGRSPVVVALLEREYGTRKAATSQKQKKQRLSERVIAQRGGQFIVFTDINYVMGSLHEADCQTLQQDTQKHGQPERCRERKQGDQQRVQ